MIERKDPWFDDFVCIAEKCPESCCIGWQIMIDEASLERYQQDPEIRDGVDFAEECFFQDHGRCSMLREDGLCRIQARLGHDALSYTCQTYPRHTEDFEGEREYSLSLSCPEAARRILRSKEKAGILETEDDREEEEDFEDFDFLLYSKLQDARLRIFEIVQNRQYSIEERMQRLLLFAEKLQIAWDNGDLDCMDRVIEEATAEGDTAMSGLVRVKSFSLAEEKQCFSILFDLETLHKDWDELLERTWDYLQLIEKNADDTEVLRDSFGENSIEAEQMLFSLLYTYFLGAVYDDRIYAKVAFCIYSVRWSFLLALANDTLSLTEAVYKYAREVEHSDLNLIALDDYFDTLV